ncbi:pyridoxal kinase [Entamoeba marina]
MCSTVLSISSFVCSGYVGNRCGMIILDNFQVPATFILTTHFANHTGYPTVGGRSVELQEYQSIIQSLSKNNLDCNLEYIVTGYFPSGELAAETIETVKNYKNKQNIFFLCDPILGDDGVMYTKKEVLHYMKCLVQLADIITPNATELALLSDMNIESLDDAIKACNVLHSQGIPIIVVTSIPTGNDILLLCSFKNGNFTGVGDSLTYLLLSWLIKGVPVENALNRAISTLQCILQCTKDNEEISIISNIPHLQNTQESCTIKYLD